MNVTDDIDTWSTMVEFDSVCVNITEVNFTGSITPTNASWGHHGDHIYIGGTDLDNRTGDYLLATLTVECNGSSCGPVNLNFTGEEGVERLMAGPPDGSHGDKPRIATIYSATWTNGSAQCVGWCGDVNEDHTVNVLDVLGVYRRALDPSYQLKVPWAADVNCDGNINVLDVLGVYRKALDPNYDLGCCCEQK